MAPCRHRTALARSRLRRTCPRTPPFADWPRGCVETDAKGFVVTGRSGLSLETSVPGVFAVGDVRAGSTERVAAAVGEGAAVVARIPATIADRAARQDA